MFVKQTLKISQHISPSVTTLESLFIEISNQKKRSKTIIGVIYRPPNTDPSLFNNEIENVIKSLTKTKTNFILAGDYNIYLLNH